MRTTRKRERRRRRMRILTAGVFFPLSCPPPSVKARLLFLLARVRHYHWTRSGKSRLRQDESPRGSEERTKRTSSQRKTEEEEEEERRQKKKKKLADERNDLPLPLFFLTVPRTKMMLTLAGEGRRRRRRLRERRPAEEGRGER